MSDVETLLRSQVVIPDRRQVWEWAGGTREDKSDAAVNFGTSAAFRGTYDVNNVPWTREFLRACNDPLVREITFIAPPQDSGKTKAAETYLAKRIATEPCNMAFNTSTNVKANKWSETRWDQMLQSTRGISERFAGRYAKKKNLILFKDGTFLLIQGAEVEGNRASDSVEVQVNDEVYLWGDGWLKEMHDRTNAYRDTCKKINISVGGRKGGELHQRFLAGNQLEWEHLCPKCRQPFAYVFNLRRPDAGQKPNIKFDLTKAIMHEDGRLDLREFAPTIRVQCTTCGHEMGYDRERLVRQNREGIYIPRNLGADPSIVSLHVNAFAIGREPWVEILEPWVRLHLRGGVFAKVTVTEFVRKKLAEFDDERPIVVTSEIKTAAFTRADVIKPKSWSEELFRVMGFDNQKGSRGDIPHRWFACVAFSKTGRLRLIDAGRVDEWEKLAEKQRELGVPNPTEAEPGPWVAGDRRYDPVEVDEWCARKKWTGSMGSPLVEFLHPPYSPFAGTRQVFSEQRAIDIGYGTEEQGRTYAIYFLWSSQRIQSLFAKLRNEGKLEIPSDFAQWCPELPTHLNSHRHEVVIERGKEKTVWVRIGDTPDHVYDCICQCIVIGCMAGIYKLNDDQPGDSKNGQ